MTPTNIPARIVAPRWPARFPPAPPGIMPGRRPPPRPGVLLTWWWGWPQNPRLRPFYAHTRIPAWTEWDERMWRRAQWRNPWFGVR